MRSRQDLKVFALQDAPSGLIATKEVRDYAKLQKSSLMQPVDERSVWSIICFVVPSECRKQGVPKQLLAGATELDYAEWARFLR